MIIVENSTSQHGLNEEEEEEEEKELHQEGKEEGVSSVHLLLS